MTTAEKYVTAAYCVIFAVPYAVEVSVCFCVSASPVHPPDESAAFAAVLPANEFCTIVMPW